MLKKVRLKINKLILCFKFYYEASIKFYWRKSLLREKNFLFNQKRQQTQVNGKALFVRKTFWQRYSIRLTPVQNTEQANFGFSDQMAQQFAYLSEKN